MISVLVVDDSFFMRKLISDILSTDSEIRVIGTANNGSEAIAATAKLKPDVITMDLEMPDMDGLTATKKIMSENGPSRSIVIMLSAFTKDRADSTLDCLKAGAFDCVLKPSGSLSLNIKNVERELIASVKAAASARKETLKRTHEEQKEKPMPTINNQAFPLVLMGASTGGPPVLEEIVSHLSSPISAAILIVQHMPEKFTASFARRMDSLSSIKVKEAEEDEVIKAGIALVAPGNFHMHVKEKNENGETVTRVHLSKENPVQGMRPSIDVLMKSAVKHYDGALIGVLMTGMGQDGQEGMRAIKAKGGTTIAQDPTTCIVDSMVSDIIEDKTADRILQPLQIAQYLSSLPTA